MEIMKFTKSYSRTVKNNVKKIKLPIITDFPERDKWLSMDEYIRFLDFTAAHFRQRKHNKINEINMLVNVPFSIK